MSFELVVAAKRDPLDGAEQHSLSASRYTSMTLNGILSGAASAEVLQTVTTLFDEGAESIIVDMERIDCDDANGLTLLTEGLMEIRSQGRHVQVSVQQLPLHDRLAKLPDARDWLIAYTDPTVSTARRAFHVDHPRPEP